MNQKLGIKDSSHREIVLILVIYTLAFGLILINNGIFWDDWYLAGCDKKDLISYFTPHRRPIYAFWFNLIFPFHNAVLIFHGIIFLSYLLASLSLNFVLKNVQEFDSFERLSISLFFAIYPVNTVRIMVCTSMYAVGYGLFFVSLGIASMAIRNRSWLLRGLSLSIFVISFFCAESLGLFYSVVLFYVGYVERKGLKDNPVRTILRHLDFAVPPVLFWFVRQIILKSSAQDYRQIRISGIWDIGAGCWSALKISLIEVMENAMHMSFATILVVILLSFVLMKYLSRGNSQLTTSNCKFPLSICGVGLLFTLLGVLPYVLSGSQIGLLDSMSRHQMLIPIGASLILYSLIKTTTILLHLGTSGYRFICAFLLVAMLQANAQSCLDWQKDFYKQCAIIENLKKASFLKPTDTYTFVDSTYGLNANRRIYRPYDFEGPVTYALIPDATVGFDLRHFRSMKYFYKFHFLVNNDVLKTRSKDPTSYKITITHGVFDEIIPDFQRMYLRKLSNAMTLQLLFFEYFRPSVFKSDISKLVQMKIEIVKGD